MLNVVKLFSRSIKREFGFIMCGFHHLIILPPYVFIVISWSLCIRQFHETLFYTQNILTADFSIIVFIKYFSLQYKNVTHYNKIL